jgi:hypothetical protein
LIENHLSVPTCRSRQPSRADAVKVGRHSNIEARSAIARPHLDGVEHGGRIEAHRDDGRDLDA